MAILDPQNRPADYAKGDAKGDTKDLFCVTCHPVTKTNMPDREFRINTKFFILLIAHLEVHHIKQTGMNASLALSFHG
jgi:hypothetical protein